MSVNISKKGVCLTLSQARGKVRISDENGNHFAKPTEAKNSESNSVEWMIRNDEVEPLIRLFMGDSDRELLLKDLAGIVNFMKQTKFATREAIKTIAKDLGMFGDFKIYEYTEKFYSFEKELSSKIKVSVTFKMGDYTLAPHMFVIIPFSHPSVSLRNIGGTIQPDRILGSKCMAIWNPSKEDVHGITEALAHSSEKHRDDLVGIIKTINPSQS